MRNKSFVVLCVVALCLLVVSVSFEGVDVSSRAIITGIGVDVANDEFEICAETVSPTGATEQASAGSKLLTSKGKTLEQTFENLFAQTGQLPSLGQCQILILGSGLQNVDQVKHVCEFFTDYLTFRDSTTVCVAENTAKELMLCQSPAVPSVSLALSAQLHKQEKSFGVCSNDVNRFVKEQMQNGKATYANLIRTTPDFDENREDGQTKASAYYLCNTYCVFKDFAPIGCLDDDESFAFSLVKGAIGQTVNYHANGDQYHSPIGAVGISKADAKITDCNLPDKRCTLDLSAVVKKEYFGQIEKSGLLFPKKQPQLSDGELQQIESTVQAKLQKLTNKLAFLNADLLQTYKAFHVEYKKQWTDSPVDVQDLDVQINVSVTNVN